MMMQQIIWRASKFNWKTLGLAGKQNNYRMLWTELTSFRAAIDLPCRPTIFGSSGSSCAIIQAE